jgi:hypothetical protein
VMTEAKRIIAALPAVNIVRKTFPSLG